MVVGRGGKLLKFWHFNVTELAVDGGVAQELIYPLIPLAHLLKRLPTKRLGKWESQTNSIMASLVFFYITHQRVHKII